MAETTLEAVLRRDRAVVVAALILVTTLAWAYLLWAAATMDMGGAAPPMPAPAGSVSDMEMPGMDMGAKPADAAAVLAPSLAPWSAADAVFMTAMWAVMMVGMMTPSAAPMILIYARVGRQAEAQGRPFASTAWFAAGYLVAWVGFAVIATAAQFALERAALLTPMMASASPIFGGLVLIAAGLYQWAPLKDRCLSYCQSPLVFIQRHGGFRREPRGALLFGLQHGAYCIGCCWALMILLFVGGVMNVLWIAAIAIFVFAEKTVPAGTVLSRIAGTAFLALGLSLMLEISFQIPARHLDPPATSAFR